MSRRPPPADPGRGAHGLPYAVRRALAHVRALSSGPPLDPSLRVTLNFHPDRLVRGEPILAAMARDGRYRSQFETGTGNGGLTAHPGGDRWRWESRIFGCAYDDAEPPLRPKYGGLDLRRSPYGAAPRFGSAHVRLAAHALERTTFCFPDSVFEPEHFGTATAFALAEVAEASGHDRLDDYVEAHVHGELHLVDDVEALVLDPGYRGTEVEGDALRLGVPVEWHPGYRLDVATLREHPDYRGPELVALAESLAIDGVVTPQVLGAAARSGRHDEQALKRVWHYVARFGALSAQPRPGRGLRPGPPS
ncbi:DUF3626 domain-containing protein [Terrabacter aerolatus]|uniref:DUF3626 domain-containing protein n=1 Tax=Terrabacter aerolatus TaxID=422442 RepID=A0A512D131_9MICO|nr:DUF3626 domain-containing protein [Terrabacter aerolatus]GEO30162.1 hypothetical protein TAE01_19720 [Terrabacter aerolatus]